MELQEKYGEIEEMNVCDNFGDHLVGNVYVKFRWEEDADWSVAELNNGGSMGKLCTPSCLLSPTSGSHAVASMRWGNVLEVASATSCICSPFPGTSGAAAAEELGTASLGPGTLTVLCGRGAVFGSPAITAPQMGPGLRLSTALLLLALAPPPEASQYCGRLEYWNPDNKCCSVCLQRFGPPPCPDYEFEENCGLNDHGDIVKHAFRECPPGRCNPDGAELCSPCGGGATIPTPAAGGARTPWRCRERPVPAKGHCPLTPGNPGASSSQEPTSLASSIASTTPEPVPGQTLPSFIPLLVLVLLLTLVVTAILLFALLWHLCRPKGKVDPYPSPGLVCGVLNTHTPSSSNLSSPGALETGDTWKEVSLLPLLSRELPSLASQPLSRLLDELEVLEELIVLLDPEPGPGGGMAHGTTRHLAARYGVPAAWATFAYSLRPSRSPLRALIEMVVAREPSASLGQLCTHLAQLGRADALQVLSKLG
ncbi:IGF-like family receptor 1 [Plecturocebus cupreus]